MKRSLCILLSLVLMLSVFSGCTGDPPETTAPSTMPSVSETTPPTEPAETPAPALEELRQNLPVMDGSTSLIPLEAGIRAALFGISIEEATKDVSHTSSWSSFHNLLNGTVDLIFSVPLSENQIELGENSGVAPMAVPIAKEGFVFVVNADNPVDALTQQQIRDIYSGKITNWSQVGGLDEEIIPYQRNYDSGSQNYMLEFMGDTPLTGAPTELRPGSMFGLMEVIAAMDNSRAAIGYSVYAYAADMYGNGNEIKFIKVDGVAPSKQSFADGSYPLMGYNYAIYRAEDRKGTHVSQLVDWILSDAGQTAIAEAGYVTIRDIGYDYAEATLDRYEGIGTGATPPEQAPSHEYKIIQAIHYQYDWGSNTNYYNTLSLNEENHLTQLADKALESEINGWIDAQIQLLRPQADDMGEIVNTLNSGSNFSRYTVGDPIYCEISVKNGFLSAAVSLCYGDNSMYTHNKHYRTETAIWDLLTGEKLAPEELFCQGVDIDGVLNRYISDYTLVPRREFGHSPEMKQDFAALAKTGWHLSLDGIYIDYGSDAFANGEFIPLDWLPDGILATDIPRDFYESILCGEDLTVTKAIRVSDRDLAYAYYAQHGNYELYDTEILKEDCHPNAAKINEDLLTYLATYYQRETIYDYFTSLGYPREDMNVEWLNWYSSVLGGRYFLAEGSNPYVFVSSGNGIVYYPHDSHLLYDLETGERMEWTALFEGDWLANSTMRLCYPDEPVEVPYYEGLVTQWFHYDSVQNIFTVCLADAQQEYYLYIPGEYVRF